MMIILSAVIVSRETCTISPYAQVLPEPSASPGSISQALALWPESLTQSTRIQAGIVSRETVR